MKENKQDKELIASYQLAIERIRSRLRYELAKYGYTLSQLAKSKSLAPPAQFDLNLEWDNYYQSKGVKPSLPNPYEYSQYHEAVRLKELITSLNPSEADEAFGTLLQGFNK